jgi:hypothetical protein
MKRPLPQTHPTKEPGALLSPWWGASLFLLIHSLVMGWVVWPSINTNGFLVAWDGGAHLAKAHLWARHFFMEGHWASWLPTWHGGIDIIQTYPPMTTYLLGPLSLLMNPELALRIYCAFLWILLLPALFVFLKCFDVSTLPAAMGASFIMLCGASFSAGLSALYGVGLLANSLGFAMTFFFLGSLNKTLSSLHGRRMIFLSALLGAGLLLSHSYSFYWALLASFFLLVGNVSAGRVNRTEVLKRFLIVFSLTLLLSAFWWVPFAMNIPNVSTPEPIEQAPLMQVFLRLIRGDQNGGGLMMIAAAGGLITLLKRRNWSTLLFFVGTGVLTLLLAMNIINSWMPFGKVIGSSERIRFEGFFAGLSLALGAISLDALWRSVSRLGKGPAITALGLSGLVFYAALLLPSLQRNRGFVRAAQNETALSINELGSVLDRRLNAGEFILAEVSWNARPVFGTPHFVSSRAPLVSNKIWSLSGWYPECTRASARPLLIGQNLWNAGYLNSQETYLRKRGVRYLVSTQSDTRESLKKISWLTLIWEGPETIIKGKGDGSENGVLSLFELTGFNTPLGLTPETAKRLSLLTYDDAGRTTALFSSPASFDIGDSFAFSYHPWLRVKADGKTMKTAPDDLAKLSLLDAARDVRQLEFYYSPPWFLWGGYLVSLLTLCGVLWKGRLLLNRFRSLA